MVSSSSQSGTLSFVQAVLLSMNGNWPTTMGGYTYGKSVVVWTHNIKAISTIWISMNIWWSEIRNSMTMLPCQFVSAKRGIEQLLWDINIYKPTNLGVWANNIGNMRRTYADGSCHQGFGQRSKFVFWYSDISKNMIHNLDKPQYISRYWNYWSTLLMKGAHGSASHGLSRWWSKWRSSACQGPIAICEGAT